MTESLLQKKKKQINKKKNRIILCYSNVELKIFELFDVLTIAIKCIEKKVVFVKKN